MKHAHALLSNKLFTQILHNAVKFVQLSMLEIHLLSSTREAVISSNRIYR